MGNALIIGLIGSGLGLLIAGAIAFFVVYAAAKSFGILGDRRD